MGAGTVLSLSTAFQVESLTTGNRCSMITQFIPSFLGSEVQMILVLCTKLRLLLLLLLLRLRRLCLRRPDVWCRQRAFYLHVFGH